MLAPALFLRSAARARSVAQPRTAGRACPVGVLACTTLRQGTSQAQQRGARFVGQGQVGAGELAQSSCHGVAPAAIDDPEPWGIGHESASGRGSAQRAPLGAARARLHRATGAPTAAHPAVGYRRIAHPGAYRSGSQAATRSRRWVCRLRAVYRCCSARPCSPPRSTSPPDWSAFDPSTAGFRLISHPPGMRYLM